MHNRPLSLTIISWLFIAVGALALTYHLLPQNLHQVSGPDSLDQGLIWACLTNLLAVVCGIFMLLGFNWARWLLALWMAGHIVLSALHSAFQTVVHALLFGLIAYFLFRSRASAWFRHKPRS